MINPDDMLRELLQTFQVEAAEHLQTLNTTLLSLEVRPEEKRRRELVQEAFRAAHSLKGAARAVSLDQIEQLANGMETVLQGARDAGVHLEAATYDILYDVLDTIGLLLQGQTVAIEPLISRLIPGEESESAETPVSATPMIEIRPAPAIAKPLPAPAPPPQPTSLSAPTADDSRPKRLAASGDDTIRVAITKLDNLMAEVDELLVSRMNAEQRTAEMQHICQQNTVWPKLWQEVKSLLPHINDDVGKRLMEILSHYQEQSQSTTQEINHFNQRLRQDSQRLGIIVSQLQDNVRHVRMVPFETLVPGLQRTVRDAAHSEGKQAVFEVAGGEVELDKKVLETLKDPFIHLLRNAVGHGIETPEVRQNQGKPAEGCIRLTLHQRGAEVRISISDDGAGFDLNGLRQAGSKQNITSPDGASQNDIIELAFQPGITTSPEVTALSGRGIGLDVVRQQLEALQGYIEVESVSGKGATIHLVVPVTLTISRGLLVQVGNERYVLPLLSVLKIIRPQQTFTLEGQTMVSMEGVTVPLVSLAGLLNRSIPSPEGKGLLTVIMAVAEQRLALLVDDVITELELAVKPLGKPLHRVRNIAGAALMGDGKPVVILNAAELVRAARGNHKPMPILHQAVPQERTKAHILVVDDSITTRTLEKHILEASGYEVTTAMDGEQALQRLQAKGIDLVVSDVQMPNMDGIALTGYLRGNAEYQDLPIILVTSLESSEDRERGMEAGANAYIVKRGFNQEELLKIVQQLIFIEED